MFAISNSKIFLSLFLGCIIALSSFDLILDFRNQTSWSHLISEGIILSISLVLFGLIWIQAYRLKKETQILGKELKASREEARLWQEKNQEMIHGLNQSIDEQFNHWKLTRAEKEVALFLLKGLSLKEIAQLREVSERTVRQQSIEIYRKSKLAGRAEFAAFFLDDLMAPLSL